MRTKLNLLLLFLMLCSFRHASLAQTARIDSIRALLVNAKDDTSKVLNLNALAWEFNNINPDTAYILNMQALRLSEKLPCYEAGTGTGWLMGMGRTYSGLSVVHRVKGNYDKSIEEGMKGIACWDKRGSIEKTPSALTLKYKAIITGNIGITFKDQGNYPAALEYFLKALKTDEAFGNKKGMSRHLSNMGNVYMKQEDYDKALDHYFRSLKLVEDLGDKAQLPSKLGNIANIYLVKRDFAKALEYYDRVVKIDEELNDLNGLASDYANIGVVYFEKKEFGPALEFTLKSLKLREETGNKRGIALSAVNMGEFYKEQGNYKEAEKWLLKALSLSEEIHALNLVSGEHEQLSDLYSKTGEWEKAMKHYTAFISTRDSMLNEENTKKTVRLEMNYEFDKKEAATKAEQDKKDVLAASELRQQKLLRNGFVGGFAVVLLFAGVFFTQRNRIGKEKKRSDELLLNILPAEVAEELKDKGSADAQLIEEVTVLFTDFKGFTAMSEKLSPKELVKDIHECFSAFDHIMEKHGMEKIKTIGDSYMAAGGLPTPNKTHATDAVKAALEIREFIAEGKARKLAMGAPYFDIRIGIHTGPVVAGIVGVKKFQYDIWGDTVNTASRMESSGEISKVNISETTYGLVKDQFTCNYRGEIEAKGKGKVKMYFVESDQTETGSSV